ncbi:DUF1993 domain-containing protein [Candidatus Peregrinibacteria bacterium]|nr:DUF1993 domain-containing protein [Candidatus Peregrinibacteria bacterium]
MEQTNLYSVTVPPMKKALQALSAMLDKAMAHAEVKGSEWRPGSAQMEALLHSRLIFDQFSLVKQIQVACDNAKGAVGRLAEIEIPSFEDNEQTVEELKERISKTIEFMESVQPEQIIGKEDIKVSLPYFHGKYFTGFEYVTEYLLPNFFFHITTAYSIMRQNGIELGKTDYIGGLPLKDL